MSQWDPPPPHIIQMVFKMVSTAWSIWWRGPEHNSWYNCYFADSLGKIQYLQLSGDSLEPPPQNLLNDIFLFLTFHVRSLGLRSVATHTFYFYTITDWLSHFECLYVPTVFVAQIFSDQSEIFFVVTLKYFFGGNHSESGTIIRNCLETRARSPIEFFHCANTEWKYRKTLVFNSLFG